MARRALLEARPDLALSRGQLVLSADPRNSDARVVVLLAALVLDDGRAYRAALRDLWREHRLPNAESALDLAALLQMQVGGDAADIFLSAYAEARQVTPEETEAPLPHERWRQLHPETSGPTPSPPNP